MKTTLETSGKDVKLHSKRVEKMRNYTRDEWKRCETTLETSGDEVKTALETSGEDITHLKINNFIELCLHTVASLFTDTWNYTRNEWRRCKTTLKTSGKDIETTLKTSGEDMD